VRLAQEVVQGLRVGWNGHVSEVKWRREGLQPKKIPLRTALELRLVMAKRT
jgi:hypothetical protein